MGEQQDKPDNLDADIDAAIEACGGNPRAAIAALLISQAFYEGELARVDAELQQLAEAVSRGFTRGRVAACRPAGKSG